MARSKRNDKGHLSDCRSDPERMSTEHLRELFNSVPEAVLQRRINALPDKGMQTAVRLAARSITAA